MPSSKQKLYFHRKVELEIDNYNLSDNTFWVIFSLNCSWVFLIKKNFRQSCSYKIVLIKDNECTLLQVLLKMSDKISPRYRMWTSLLISLSVFSFLLVTCAGIFHSPVLFVSFLGSINLFDWVGVISRRLSFASFFSSTRGKCFPSVLHIHLFILYRASVEIFGSFEEDSWRPCADQWQAYIQWDAECNKLSHSACSEREKQKLKYENLFGSNLQLL